MLIIEKVAILKRTEMFAETPGFILAVVAEIIKEVNLNTGDVFIQEGALEDAMYIIVEGRAEVMVGGNKVAQLGAGEMVGEMQVLDPAPRSASVIAATPMRLFRIKKDAFDAVAADRPEIAQGINRVLVRRLRVATSQLELNPEKSSPSVT